MNSSCPLHIIWIPYQIQIYCILLDPAECSGDALTFGMNLALGLCFHTGWGLVHPVCSWNLCLQNLSTFLSCQNELWVQRWVVLALSDLHSELDCRYKFCLSSLYLQKGHHSFRKWPHNVYTLWGIRESERWFMACIREESSIQQFHFSLYCKLNIDLVVRLGDL